MQRVNINKKAFSLIEVSIVILVLAIISSGIILLSDTKSSAKKVVISEKKIEDIYKALRIFITKNYRLPCPASITLTKDQSGYGHESTSSVQLNTYRECDVIDGVYNHNKEGSRIVYGMVPVHALGLGDEYAQDSYGAKFSYIVHESLTIPNYSNSDGGVDGFSYFDEDSTQMIQVIDDRSGSVIEKVAFAIISHGENGLGSFKSSSIFQNSISGADVSEEYNFLSEYSGFTASFGNNPSYPDRVTFRSSQTGSNDDKVFFKTRSQIIADFGLEFLNFCDGSDQNYESNYPFAYSDQTVYRSYPCEYHPGIFPSKKCDRNGEVWVNRQECPAFELIVDDFTVES